MKFELYEQLSVGRIDSASRPLTIASGSQDFLRTATVSEVPDSSAVKTIRPIATKSTAAAEATITGASASFKYY